MERLQRVRAEHANKRRILQDKVKEVLPPLFQKAHLRHVNPKLADKLLDTKSEGEGALLWGTPGVGKSYALCGLMRFFLMLGFSVRRSTFDDLCLEVRETYTSGQSEAAIVQKYREPDVLLVEDLGTSVGVGGQESDFSLRLLLLILDYRIEHLKPTYFSTNKSIDDLTAGFDARVTSRLHQACEIIPVTGQDRRKRRDQNQRK